MTEKHSIFKRSLGEQTFNKMPLALRSFHDTSVSTVWSGVGSVNTGAWPAKVLSKLFGFPSAGDNIPITVTVDHELDKKGLWQERWTRNFDGASFNSLLKVAPNNQLTETFPPFVFKIGISANEEQLTMPLDGWRMGPIPLPKFLGPVSEAREFQDKQGRFCFDVKLSHPLFGLMAHYQGWLVEKR